jgi:peptidoglycan/xylan/chitin deacetylase (PgdA/CDA1 family)
MIKSRLIQSVGALGGYQCARLLTRNQPKILMYHRFSKIKCGHEVTSATFEKQLKKIKRNFNPMTLADLSLHIQRTGRAPANAVVITVDDGYRDFYEVAYPLLKQYKVPATFFVTTGFVNGDVWLWPDQVAWLLDNKITGVKTNLAGSDFNLGLPAAELWWPIVGHFLNVSDAMRMEAMQNLALACDVSLPTIVPEKYAAVNWLQLAEMQDNGIEIGGHTVNHPSLGLMDEESARQEILQSYADIVQHLGEHPRTFCYPNGQPSDYSMAIKKMVQDSPYLAAVTAYSDKYNVELDYAWRRFVGCEDDFQFNKSLFGVEHLGNTFRGTTRSTI